MSISVEEKGLKNQIGRLETLRVSTCLKSHSFKKYTNEQLETIIEDLKDIHKGLEDFNNKPQPIKNSYPLNQPQEIIFYEEKDIEICLTGLKFDINSQDSDLKEVQKSLKKIGIFEKFFNFFGR